jgi:hypothetical protein
MTLGQLEMDRAVRQGYRVGDDLLLQGSDGDGDHRRNFEQKKKLTSKKRKKCGEKDLLLAVSFSGVASWVRQVGQQQWLMMIATLGRTDTCPQQQKV